jgi:GT2 family glycosyltransferase/precorrin-6B methylase 2
MRLTYLILTWNRKDALKRHLGLLLEQTYREPFEVIVCVDGSTDGTQKMLATRKKNPRYSLKWYDTGNKDKNTAAQAKNMGIRNAAGDVLIMLDDDCLPHPQLIESYLREFNPQEVQVGYKSDSESYLALGLPVPIEPGLMTIWMQGKVNGDFHHFQTGNVCMSISAARTPAKDGSIGFDERFVGYGHEDSELGRRLASIGHRFHFNPNAVTWHMHPGAVLQQDPELKKAQAVESNALFQQIIEEPLPLGALPYPGFVNTMGMMAVGELRWLYETAKQIRSVVEVGSFAGRSTHALLCACPGLVYSIDPRDPAFIGSEEAAANLRQSFFENVGAFDNLAVMETYSERAARAFPDASVDMVFIDGDHVYEAVKADIAAWLPKTKKLIAGHDYSENQFSGVVRAVKEAFGDNFRVCETIWYAEIKG